MEVRAANRSPLHGQLGLKGAATQRGVHRAHRPKSMRTPHTPHLCTTHKNEMKGRRTPKRLL